MRREAVRQTELVESLGQLIRQSRRIPVPDEGKIVVRVSRRIPIPDEEQGIVVR